MGKTRSKIARGVYSLGPSKVRLYIAALHPSQFAGRTLCSVFSPAGCPGRVILDGVPFRQAQKALVMWGRGEEKL